MKLPRLVTGAALALALAVPVVSGVVYSYDSAGRLKKAVYPNGAIVEYLYDAAGNRREVLVTGVSGPPEPPPHDPPNEPPVAIDDAYTVTVSSTTSMKVAVNDYDPEGRPLVLTVHSQPSAGGGQVVLVTPTVLNYTAPATTGTRSFEYKITDDGGRSSIGTVTVHVINGPSNQSPSAEDDHNVQVTANGSVTIPVLLNDTDPNGDALSVTAVTQPSAGSTTRVDNNTRIRFDAPSTPGTYTFDYSITDGQSGPTPSARVYVLVTTVNGAPTANADFKTVVSGDATAIMVRANDTDPDNDPLTITNIWDVTGGAGAAISPGGSYIIYQGPPTAGVYTLRYRITDGHTNFAEALVTIEVVNLEIEGCDRSSNTICVETL